MTPIIKAAMASLKEKYKNDPLWQAPQINHYVYDETTGKHFRETSSKEYVSSSDNSSNRYLVSNKPLGANEPEALELLLQDNPDFYQTKMLSDNTVVMSVSPIMFYLSYRGGIFDDLIFSYFKIELYEAGLIDPHDEPTIPFTAYHLNIIGQIAPNLMKAIMMLLKEEVQAKQLAEVLSPNIINHVTHYSPTTGQMLSTFVETHLDGPPAA